MDGGSSQYVLSGEVLLVRYGRRCNLLLKESLLDFQVGGTAEEEDLVDLPNYPIEDILGLQVLKVPASSGLSSCRANLCVYRKTSEAKPSRVLYKESLEFTEDNESFDNNYKTAMEWREAIQSQRLKNSREIFISDWPEGI